MSNIFRSLLLSMFACIGTLYLGSGSALAFSSLINDFNSRYGTAGTVLDSCSICHPSVPALNSYGADFAGSFDFVAIEGLDSDGDGFVNLDEINAGTWPGDATSFPAAAPTCTDADSDGFAVEGGACGLTDCVPQDATIFPGAVEICGDGIDQDCSGADLPCGDTALPAPAMTLLADGLVVTVQWTQVSGASGYELFYAPYPFAGPETINSFDVGSDTSFSAELWPDAAYFIAIQAYNEGGNSPYSNVDFFHLQSADQGGAGVDLYVANCAGCHGLLDSSDVAGESAAEIAEAIAEDEGGMGFLADLTAEQLTAIAEVLSTGVETSPEHEEEDD